jgi:uncharacterized damage-inducible protein DinB
MKLHVPIFCLLVAGIVGTASSQTFENLKASLIAQIDAAGSKLVQLAEAESQEQYSWRPMEGVRSVSEVYMHVALGNYNFLRMAGVTPPVKMERGLEKSVTTKADVIDWLKKSFVFAKKSIESMTEQDFAKETKMFGQDVTNGVVIVTLASHDHEHLGQSIAYARMNKVVPPWSM